MTRRRLLVRWKASESTGSRFWMLDASGFDAMFSAPVVSREEFFAHYKLVRLAPADCQILQLESASIDALTSRSVFEHIRK